MVVGDFADDGVAVSGVVPGIEIGHIINGQSDLFVRAAAGLQIGIGGRFRQQIIKYIIAAKQHVIMESLSQRQSDLLLRDGRTIIQKCDFGGENLR